MYGSLQQELVEELDELREARLYKGELVLESPQSAHVEVEGMGGLLNLCANNYLGLADHPAVIEAAREALERWGFGMASVRFICGTQTLHKELEERLSAFLGTEDTILFSSCFDANGGLFEALLGADDAVISDALNHASIIDGIRLCKAERLRYANGDLDELEARLEEAAGAHTRMIATDGVFSMDGYIADLAGICDLADRHDALVMVDDSHAVGFVGPNGRGTPELHGVIERVDILTGTLGKAMGGASGGYVSGRREIVELLRQRARPYLFSNSVAPPIAAAGLKAIELVEGSPELRDRLWANTARFRARDDRGRVRHRRGDAPDRAGDDGRRRRRGRLRRAALGEAASTRSASRSRSSRAGRRASARSSRPPTPSTTSTSRWRSSSPCGTSSAEPDARHRSDAAHRGAVVHEPPPRPPLGHGCRRAGAARRRRALPPGRRHRRRRGDGLGDPRAPLGRARDPGRRRCPAAARPRARDRDLVQRRRRDRRGPALVGQGDAGGRSRSTASGSTSAPTSGPRGSATSGRTPRRRRAVGLDEARLPDPPADAPRGAVGAPLDRSRRARPRQQRGLLAGGRGLVRARGHRCRNTAAGRARLPRPDRPRRRVELRRSAARRARCLAFVVDGSVRAVAAVGRLC